MSTTRKIFLFVALPLILLLLAVAGYSLVGKDYGSSNDQKMTAEQAAVCNSFQLESPVDLSLVTSVLYPGQVRGGDFKPHGGFRLDNQKNNTVNVTAPYDASVYAGSRYIEQGEVQYMFDFMTSCGINYRFDHLKTLSPQFQALADQLPEAKVDDSRTADIAAGTAGDVKTGDIIATAVGFEKGNNGLNVGFDFGVYDKRKMNIASSDEQWLAAHKEEGDQAFYAVCWLDLLPAESSKLLKDLPAGDASAGKTSDYCKK